jgi:hypothetical protein
LTLEHIKLLTHVQNHPQNQLRGWFRRYRIVWSPKHPV